MGSWLSTRNSVYKPCRWEPQLGGFNITWNCLVALTAGTNGSLMPLRKGSASLSLFCLHLSETCPPYDKCKKNASFAWSHDASPEGGSNPPPPAGAVLRGRGPGMLLQWSLPGRLANSSWRSSADCWVQKVARRARLAKGFYYPTPEDRRTKQRPGNSWEWTWRTQ